MQVIVEHIDTTDVIDRLVFGPTDAMTAAELGARQLDAMTQAVTHHLDWCASYRAFAERVGFRVADLDSPDRLVLVPQIPSAAFKRDRIVSGEPTAGLTRCFSTGTRGPRSVVHRDRTTMQRLLGSVRVGTQLVGDLDDERVVVVDLGPPPDEQSPVWFSYLMSLVEIDHVTEHMARRGRLDLEAAAERIRDLLDQGFDVLVVGIPPLVAALAERARRPDVHVQAPGRIRIVTGGGWKQAEDRSLEPERFRELVMAAWGLEDTGAVRDTYNQVELNTVIFECSHHRKHLPPWLSVLIRDPADLTVMGPGHTGLITYLDPTAVSYPAFVVTDDLGRLETRPCPCGDSRPSLVIDRRVTRRGERGCALSLSAAIVPSTEEP